MMMSLAVEHNAVYRKIDANNTSNQSAIRRAPARYDYNCQGIIPTPYGKNCGLSGFSCQVCGFACAVDSAPQCSHCCYWNGPADPFSSGAKDTTGQLDYLAALRQDLESSGTSIEQMKE